MQIHRDELIGGRQSYLVLGRAINGHDWRFIRHPGRLIVLKPTPSGDEIEVPWEPAEPEEQARIDRLTLFEAASWAYSIAVESERGA